MTEVNGSDFKKNEDIGDVIESLIRQYNETLEENRDKSEKWRLRYAAGSVLSYAHKVPLINWMMPKLDEKQQRIDELLIQQKETTTYEKWYQISSELDQLMGNNEWKLADESDLYDYEQIKMNLEEMKNARESNDFKLLLYLVRTKWVRNIGNMGGISLYKHSFVGTKKLIEDYIDECKLLLDYLVNDKHVDLDDRYLMGLLIQTRKNIGRTALVLSGGSTFGMFHIGVLVSLLEANLLPRIISGSSAGSIVASILCCHNNEENKQLIESLSEQEFEVFKSSDEDENTSHSKFRKLLKGIGHFLKYGTVFEMEGLKHTIKNYTGDLTFREAYNRTGKILNITVSPASLHEQTRLLNYLTAPNCLIWSAVCASCSLPGIFPSTNIYEKNPKTNKIQKWNGDSSIKFVDGSVDNDLPITRLLEMFNVDHIIAVQVNPHVVPILKISVSNPGGYLENDLTTTLKHGLNNVYDFCTSEMIHYLQILNEMNFYKNLSTKLISLLSQNYSGDITILPDYKVTDFNKIFVNPTPKFMADFIIRGARSTWPKITIINNHCGVEFALDKAITTLRGRTILATDKSTFTNSLVINPINVDPESKRNDENSQSENGKSMKKGPFTPERRRVTSVSVVKSVPKIQRHSSTSGIGTISALHRKQRNSISNFEAFLSKQPNNIISNSSTPKKERTLNSRALSDQAFEHRRISNSKSMLNMKKEEVPSKQRLKYQSDRVEWDSNPYTDGYGTEIFIDDSGTSEFFEFSAGKYGYQNGKSNGDNDTKWSGHSRSNSIEEAELEVYDISNFQGKEDKDTTEVQPKEDTKYDKPNLPKRSHNNSLTNSYIGLNRLKDAQFSKDAKLSHQDVSNVLDNINSATPTKSS